MKQTTRQLRDELYNRKDQDEMVILRKGRKVIELTVRKARHLLFSVKNQDTACEWEKVL